MRHLIDDPLPDGIYDRPQAAIVRYAQKSTRLEPIDDVTYGDLRGFLHAADHGHLPDSGAQQHGQSLPCHIPDGRRCINPGSGRSGRRHRRRLRHTDTETTAVVGRAARTGRRQRIDAAARRRCHFMPESGTRDPEDQSRHPRPAASRPSACCGRCRCGRSPPPSPCRPWLPWPCIRCPPWRPRSRRTCTFPALWSAASSPWPMAWASSPRCSPPAWCVATAACALPRSCCWARRGCWRWRHWDRALPAWRCPPGQLIQRIVPRELTSGEEPMLVESRQVQGRHARAR